MNKAAFINKVKAILNESDASITGAEMIGADMTDIAHYIEELFPSAWRRALSIFPTWWFTIASFANSTQTADAPDGTGSVLLPADFAKLVSFKLAKWDVPCTLLQDSTPHTERKQSLRYMRGTTRRPACIMRNTLHEGAMRKFLHYYSVPASATAEHHAIEHAHYIPHVHTLADSTIISSDLFEPLAYLCASQVLTSFEKDNAAKAIESKITEMIR